MGISPAQFSHQRRNPLWQQVGILHSVRHQHALHAWQAARLLYRLVHALTHQQQLDRPANLACCRQGIEGC
ncbi:hypothetical protein D3C81_2176110 [compost metagenome]